MATMTPSTEPITEGQISKAIELLSTKLRKHKQQLPSNIVQIVLGDPSLSEEWFQIFLKKVEAQSNMIVRTVKVNRTRSGREALTATGRKQYVSDSVVKAMPNGTDEEVEVCFWNIGQYISMADLEKEYELRGQRPADGFELAVVNEADPAFADEKPNATQWKDEKGKWCYAVFRRIGDDRDLGVNQDDGGWDDGLWFAGVRKKVLEP